MTRITRISLAATLMAGLSTHATADPIRIISGSLSVDMFDPQGPNNAGLTLVGDQGFRFSSEFFDPTPLWRSCGLRCEPGDVVSPDWTRTVEGNRAPLATFNGSTFPLNTTSLSFQIDGPEFPLAGSSFTYAVPFTFAGTFHFPGGSESVAGAGTASIHIRDHSTLTGGPAHLGPIFTRYTFEAADPIPEPSSVLLLATGVGLVARRALRRRSGGSSTSIH